MQLRTLLRMDLADMEDWLEKNKQSFLVLELNRVPSLLGVKPEHWGKLLLVLRAGQYQIERLVHTADTNSFNWYHGNGEAFTPDAPIEKYVVLEHETLSKLLIESKFDGCASEFAEWVAEYQGRAMLLPVFNGGLSTIQDPDDLRMWIVSSGKQVTLQAAHDVPALCRANEVVAARLPLRLQD